MKQNAEFGKTCTFFSNSPSTEVTWIGFFIVNVNKNTNSVVFSRLKSMRYSESRFFILRLKPGQIDFMISDMALLELMKIQGEITAEKLEKLKET